MKPAEADLRRIVLDASLALIDSGGLAALSMREVARRAGVSHQAPYHHFGDRDGILSAICMEGFDLLRDVAVAALAQAGPEPEAKLHAIGRAYIDFAEQHAAHFKLMFRSDFLTDESIKSVEAKGQTAFDVLVSVTDELTEKRFGKTDRAYALAAWSVAHGLATLRLEGKLKHHFGPNESDQRDAVMRALDAFTLMMLKR